MGLDHTCSPSAASRPIDHEGNQVPVCSASNPADVLATTMYASQTCGETKKASPEADDVLGICDIYPSDPNPPKCESAFTMGNCSSTAGLASSTGTSGKSNVALLMMFLLGVFALRKTTKSDT